MWTPGNHQTPGNQGPCITRPAGLDRQTPKIYLVSLTDSCWQAALRVVLGAMSSTFLKIGKVFQASLMPLGGSGSFRKASNLPTSRSAPTILPPYPSPRVWGTEQIREQRNRRSFGISEQDRRLRRRAKRDHKFPLLPSLDLLPRGYRRVHRRHATCR